MRGLLVSAFALMAGAQLVLADEIAIPGPDGPLAAERIPVAAADHAVVIVPGTGPLDRDGNGPAMNISTDLYKLLAEALEARGIASLRIDKRGFFASQHAVADPADVTIAGYAQDARDWVERAGGLASCVWLAGHSEGALVALLAAQDPPASLCGLILMAGPGRPPHEILLEQLGAMPGTAAHLAYMRAFYEDLAAGNPRDPESLPGPLSRMYSEGIQRFLVDLFSYDPQALAARWKGPVLIVQGDADLNVKPADAEALAGAMPQAVRADLEGGTHMLKQDVPGDPFATYENAALPLHPKLVQAITGFLATHAPADARPLRD